VPQSHLGEVARLETARRVALARPQAGDLNADERVLGARHSRQGVLQPPFRPPDRLGQRLARLVFRPRCQRRVGQERIQVIQQLAVALPVEHAQRGLARLGEFGGEVGADAGLHRPRDQGGGEWWRGRR